MITVIKNPDTQKEFKTWYFCNTCHKTRKQNGIIIHEKGCTSNDIRTISTDRPFIIIGEDEV